MAPEATRTQAMCRLLFPLQFRFLSVACSNRYIVDTVKNTGAVYILIAIGIWFANVSGFSSLEPA